MGASLVAMAFAWGSVIAGVVRLRKVLGVVSFDLDALRSTVGRGAAGARLADLRAALGAEGPSWEAELVAALADASTPEARTALTNESLHDVARSLDWGRQIARAAPRWAASGPLCVLFWTLARQTLSVSDAVPVIAWGAGGVVASLALGRETTRVIDRRRRSIDKWVDQLLIAAGCR